MKNIYTPLDLGRLITIDGIDATGKTTLALNLSERIWWVYFKSPWKKSKEERAYFDQPHISVQERYNFYVNANKEDILEISEVLKTGTHVVCDRFIASTIAHHLAMDETIDFKDVENINKPYWSVQVLLIATKQIILARLSERGELTRFEKDETLMMKSQQIYMQRTFDLTIDTTTSSIEETQNRVLSLINNT